MIVKFDEAALGITERSLKILRDEIARRVDHELLVLEVPTADITCGYLIVDRIANEAVFTGDGFRTDGGGEGGAGYRAAQAYLDIFRYFANVLPYDQDDGIYLLEIGANGEPSIRAFASAEIEEACKLAKMQIGAID